MLCNLRSTYRAVKLSNYYLMMIMLWFSSSVGTTTSARMSHHLAGLDSGLGSLIEEGKFTVQYHGMCSDRYQRSSKHSSYVS
jgi:hypothetical protein